MNKPKEFSVRASQLKEVVSDPLNYFTLNGRPEISTPALEHGKERELLSYELFTKFTEGKIAHYEDQKEGSITIQESNILFTLTGHADIVAPGMVVDIKNSKRTDKELINDYKWQLWAYCKIFGVYKAYLFVDTNNGNEMDLEKCRLVEIPWCGDDVWNVAMHSIAKILSHANPEPFEYVHVCQQARVLERYVRLKGEMRRIEQELTLLEKQIQEILKNHDVVRWTNYDFKLRYTRSIKREVQVKLLPWDGTYKPSFQLEEVNFVKE